MNERVWFYVETGTQRGPYTVAEVVEALRRLGPSTLVWREGLAQWVPAQTVPEFAAAPWPMPPPVPGSALPASGAQPKSSNSRTVAIVIAVVGVAMVVLVIPIIGIIAAIAIPSLLRARVAANEASAIGNVRTVVSAQAAYQSANQGFYEGRWECLSSAQTCIPGYTGPTFLDTAFFAAPRAGYVHELHGGAPAAAAKGTSPSSTDAFAVIAYPVAPGKTGVRAFCGDSSGRVCAIANGRKDELVTGSGESGVRCADACLELR
jgi:type II secretory pathway pseudopilin PulG